LFPSVTRHIHATTTTTTTTTKPQNGHGSRLPYDQDKKDATLLVDNLLEYTQSLMENMKRNTPISTSASSSSSSINEDSHHHIVAFSGGIDSSLVTALVHRVSSTFPSDRRHVVTAVLGLSPAVPSEQVRLAEQVAGHIGVTLEQIPTTEGKDEMYITNNGKACLACKTHLYTCLSTIARHVDAKRGDSNDSGSSSNNNNTHNNTNSLFQLYNGTNADDLTDPTRLGLIAADRFNVQSPLRYTSKHLVRVAGRHLGLPNWQYAASPCLRSRLALNVQAIPEHLSRIEKAEEHVRTTFRLDPTRNMRVRLLRRNEAMIEVEEDVLDSAREQVQNGTQLREYFTRELGFASVNVRRFQTGSVAQPEPLELTTTKRRRQAEIGVS
jgi:PP-loop superfamily ATP-utilizing enzyme